MNRGYSREANNALWTLALVPARSDPSTRIYVERRTGEGLSTKEIMRCLKRYIVHELYPLIFSDLSYAIRPRLIWECQYGGRMIFRFTEKRTY